MIVYRGITVTSKAQGFLIAIEGIDGTGKTSIVKSLLEKLTKDGYQVISFKEPTNETEAGKKIRQSYFLSPRQKMIGECGLSKTRH